MPALQKFLQAELHRRDWSVEDFVRRVPMSVSRGYQIINEGQDNVRQSTFANIAAALGWSSADLAARIGAGMGELDAHDLEWLDVGRLLSLDQRSSWARAVLAAANTSDDGTANHSKPRNNNRRGGQKPDLQSHDRWGIAAYASSLISLLWRARPVLAMPATATA